MSITERLRRSGYDFPTASRALRALVHNPDDLPQVFTIIDALSGSTFDRVRSRLRRSPDGGRLLEQGSELVRVLADRERLRRLPEGSLGRAYLAFVEAEGISAEGILEASARGRTVEHDDADFERVHTILRDSHDLWHAVTGYKGDILGELALLAFTTAQLQNPAIYAILAVAVGKGLARGHFELLLEGYRRGLSAAWLPAVDWVAMLERPVAEVRAELRVGALPAYTPIRSDELREAGVLAKVA